MQAGRNRGESSAGIQKLGAQLKKETSSRNLVKRFGGGENHNNNHNNNEDSSIAKIDKIGAPLTMLDKSKTLPKKPEQALDKFLFDAVYTNKYLEVKCIKEQIVKLFVDQGIADVISEDCSSCER